ncbi:MULTISPECIES: hypothetical protein [unclassified Nocardioides]|uniref:hypothetical protein n=1 Tax=unclassified Nocardioides TaxID=2615069 RepID=UPI0006F6E681|nr:MULTISPECIES: hypothetical protein [unclassified Nocardioides]KRA38983.1 hypothetical protein ASD81_10495 [Nocardioides sp. Root614]KRA92942.1 hypothetical protein ASD84_10760 [Nocardioides sp. Root682]
MTSIKRPLATLGAGVLLALSLTACGGGYPTDASSKDFCGGIEDVVTASTDLKGDEPTEDEWKKIQGAYGDLGDVGTPKKISDDEREGFETVVDVVTDLDYDEAKKEFGDKGGEDNLPGVSDEENKNVEKFFTYAQKECADQLTE